MSASTVSFMRALVSRFPQLLPVLEEHLEENYDEVLPHLLMSDVFRWMVTNRDAQSDVVRSFFAWLEQAYAGGDEDVRDLIVVSGIEMLPDPGQPGASLRAQLGEQLAEFDPWKPTR